MSDLDPPALPAGERLELLEYRADFRSRKARVTDRDCWKLERQQDFVELANPSYDAFRRGDWDAALRLTAERADSVARSAAEDAARGSVFHRVRVVAWPLSPYLHWELTLLRMQNANGMPVRVVREEQITDAERGGALPEVVVLGGRTVYRVRYTAAGRLDGAERCTDQETALRWQEYIRGLFSIGEDIGRYFEREVAPLPPPVARAG